MGMTGGRLLGRNVVRRYLAVAGATVILAVAALPAGAESEWCDVGSPPPNDFRLQQTGVASSTSSFDWLRSTDNGEAFLAEAKETGTLDVSQIPTLTGGVAFGMNTALDNTSRASR
jgi:hypothetical protein